MLGQRKFKKKREILPRLDIVFSWVTKSLRILFKKFLKLKKHYYESWTLVGSFILLAFQYSFRSDCSLVFFTILKGKSFLTSLFDHSKLMLKKFKKKNLGGWFLLRVFKTPVIPRGVAFCLSFYCLFQNFPPEGVIF